MEISYEELLEFNYEYIFDFYDIPLFFILRDENEKLYLNYMIDEINDYQIKWFFSRISRLELYNLLNKSMGVKKFLNKLINLDRMKYLYVDNKKKSLDFENVNISLIDELPVDDFYVDYDYLNNKELEINKNYSFSSNEFDLILRDDQDSHSIEVDILTKTLESFQELFKSVNKGITNLKVEAIYPSSFGIRLIGEDDLFETSRKTLENIYLMVDNIKNNKLTDIEDNVFIDQLYDLSALTKITELAKNVEKFNVSLELKTKDKADTTLKIKKSEISKFKSLNKLISDLNTTEESIIEIKGVLNSINLNRNYFSIVDEDDIKYSGKLESELKDNIADNQFVIPAEITAKLLKKQKYNYEKEENEINYVMKSYNQNKKRI
ncbi:hypothetical protein [Mammaliicoccus sciuri]|uniref:hypothetical protein n=1 Tax=Mammaliicoccus sciuri TaxID=1296 RepID=UPI002DBC5075|nr:hypothetical protein [Mammaliicoccus sciuri]MEB5758263.1 hypothetical protein [Mammaliicoccus sciuri]